MLMSFDLRDASAMAYIVGIARFFCAGRRIRSFCAGGLALFFMAGALAQGLPADLEKLWRATGVPKDALSLVVREVGGPGMVAINPSTPRNPASVDRKSTRLNSSH